MNLFKRIIEVAFAAIFPKKCIYCGEIIDDGEFLCDGCYESVTEVDSSKRCLSCGMEKKNCDCKRYVFHFCGCVAPFANDGIIRKIAYSFKFRRKFYYGEFFSRRMALCVKNELRDIKFDGVCCVPMTLKKRLKRGYNQGEILARRVSDILGIPYIENALVCRRNGRSQHELTKDERFRNVRGLYSYKDRNDGKTLLLVDDIKTTGATLDECARQLLFSGAYRVYCVTALISLNKNSSERNKNGN